MHFNKTPHTLSDFSFQCVNQVQGSSDSDRIDKLLITKEPYWSAQLLLLKKEMELLRLHIHSGLSRCILSGIAVNTNYGSLTLFTNLYALLFMLFTILYPSLRAIHFPTDRLFFAEDRQI